MQIFSVVTDTSHTAGLAMHGLILAYMFSLVENQRITVNLGPIPDNILFIQEYVASLLKSAFSHLSDNQIKVFVNGLFSLNQNVQAFKEHLRDFLIQIRVSTFFVCTWLSSVFDLVCCSRIYGLSAVYNTFCTITIHSSSVLQFLAFLIVSYRLV